MRMMVMEMMPGRRCSRLAGRGREGFVVVVVIIVVVVVDEAGDEWRGGSGGSRKERNAAVF